MAAPELAADLISEIILHLPPAYPKCLVRASLVCKLWRGLISDPTFPRRYCAFHGNPPVLGFFHNLFCDNNGPIPRFAPMTDPSPFPQPGPDFRGWRVVDCRHGRVLLGHVRSRRLAVWDPISGHREELGDRGAPHVYYTAALLRGDHGHGGSFLVVLLYPDDAAGITRARVFSSRTGAWGAPASADGSGAQRNFATLGCVAAGDAIYFMIEVCAKPEIFMYDIGKHQLSVIDQPEGFGAGTVLMPMEDGTLGLAGTDSNSILYLWSRKVNSDGVARWVQCRVIELQRLISVPIYCRAIGFAEDAGVIFVTNNGVGTFTIELKSGRAKWVARACYGYAAFPFTGFRIPDCSSDRLTLPA